MRVCTVFNRVLALEGTQVVSVDVSGTDVVVVVRRRARLHRCPCGWVSAARYDLSRRRWRHLDVAGRRLWLEADIARIDCHACEQVRTEEVPWARPSARYSRDFENQIAWLAQRMDKSAIARLMRCAWRSVDSIVKRLVAEHLNAGEDLDRLNGLIRIGVDEISYKRGHKYLTVIADHDTGRVVWVSQGRTLAAFSAFFTALGPQRRAQITAITMDMSPTYRAVAKFWVPRARICFDPFHIIKDVNHALSTVFAAIRTTLRQRPNTSKATSRADWRRARFILRRASENLTDEHQAILKRLTQEDLTLARAWELKEGLRDLYKNKTRDPKHLHTYLHTWCEAATASGIKAFITLARRIREHIHGIIAAVELGLSNSRLEGINSKIRVIQRRGYGHPQPETLIAMIHLCLGGITPKLPTQT